MRRASEAIGAVQCEQSLEGASSLASAHKATRGENCESATRAGTPPLHFPCEPSGGVLEKFWAKNTALSFWFDNGRPPTLAEWLEAMREEQEKLEPENSRGGSC